MHLETEQQLSLLDEDTESRIIANAQQRLLQKQLHLADGESGRQPLLKDLFTAVSTPDGEQMCPPPDARKKWPIRW